MFGAQFVGEDSAEVDIFDDHEVALALEGEVGFRYLKVTFVTWSFSRPLACRPSSFHKGQIVNSCASFLYYE